MVNAAVAAPAVAPHPRQHRLSGTTSCPDCINQDRIWAAAVQISHCDCRRRGAKFFGNHSSRRPLYGKPGGPGVPSMSVILFILGILVTGAGIVTIGFGIPINEFNLGNTMIVAGTTLVAAGLILIGLAAAVDQLAQIAKALRPRAGARPAPQPQAMSRLSPRGPLRVQLCRSRPRVQARSRSEVRSSLHAGSAAGPIFRQAESRGARQRTGTGGIRAGGFALRDRAFAIEPGARGSKSGGCRG